MYKMVFWRWRILRNGRSDNWTNAHSVVGIELDLKATVKAVEKIAEQLYENKSSQFSVERWTKFEWELLGKQPADYIDAKMLERYEKLVYRASIEYQLLLENINP